MWRVHPNFLGVNLHIKIMVYQASPPVAASHGLPTTHPRNIFDVIMNIAYYISSAVIFLLIIGGIVFCIHCFVLCLQLALRKLLALLRTSGLVQAAEERKKKMALKNLPPPVKYRDSRGTTCCSTCAICLEDFKDRELCQVLPLCNHAFHSDCIRPWLINNQRCPNCRTPIASQT